MGTFETFFDPRYRPPTPVLVDSEVRGTTLKKLIVDSEVRGMTLQKLIVKSESEVMKWWSDEVKWSTFGPLIFFFRYVEGRVFGYNYISIKKCTTTFLCVLHFGQVGALIKDF